MFVPCSDAPAVSESAIAAFCAGLNTPVVNIEMLEVGPARAGIMLAADTRGELNLMVRVSLISSGEGVTFKFQGDPMAYGGAASAMEAALSFSEGMGFLFEEDLLRQDDGQGRARALQIWTALCAGREKPMTEFDEFDLEVPSLQSAPSVPSLEIELTQEIPDPASNAGNGLAVGTPTGETLAQTFTESDGMGPPEETSPAAATGARVLTKFRGRRGERRGAGSVASTARGGDEQAEPPSRPGSEAFARVAIESGEIGAECVDDSGFLTRLLSSF